MKWMILPFRRYFEFSGRSRRREYWMWTLFLILAGIILAILDEWLGFGGSAVGTDPFASAANIGAFLSEGLLSNIFTLATLIPSVTVSVRRLHDINRSGWWLLSSVVPLVIAVPLMLVGAFGQRTLMLVMGGISLLAFLAVMVLLLVWCCTEGTRGPNRFGDDPKDDGMENLAETFA